MTPQFVDTSSFQGQIDFVANRKWAASFDGIARIAMKATEGTGFVDPLFRANRAAALAAGFDCIYIYHFSRPDLGNSPVAEANFMQSVVGAIRNSDMIILDYEVQSPLATAQWALAWLVEFGPKYGKIPGIYASSAYILEKLQWPGLDAFPLWLANWQFTPDERPPVPPPWSSYEFVQYTDRATIPGIQGIVDANIFLGGTTPMSTIVPSGWSDDGHTLYAPDKKFPIVSGFRGFILNPDNKWDPNDYPIEAEHGANPVEMSNVGLGAGSEQTYRMSRLGYAQGKIYKTWIGQELHWYQQQHTLLQDQLTQLLAANADLHEKLADLQPDALAQENAELKDKIEQAVKVLS